MNQVDCKIPQEVDAVTFCDEIEVASRPQREAMMRHPFVLGIGDGTLSTERFKHFMTQDYVYLIDYGQMLGDGNREGTRSDHYELVRWRGRPHP